MLVSFAAVVPFIIYAEKYRRMKQVFMGCVAVLFCAEVLLWLSGAHLWGIIAGVQLFFMAFNVMEAILPSLISKESPAGYKGTAMGSTPPASLSAWRSAAASAAGCTVCRGGHGVYRRRRVAAVWFWSAAP